MILDRPKIRGQTWLKDITDYGIVYVPTADQVRILISNSSILICSRCSKLKPKTKLDYYLPKQLYIGSQNLRFYDWCERNHFRYTILSDLYGVCFDDEQLQDYDVHPSSLSNGDFVNLSKRIKTKMAMRQYNSFLFYNTSPIMAAPYFYMVKLTGYKIYYMTKLFGFAGRRGFGLL